MAGDAGAGGSPLRRSSSTRAGTRVPTSLGHRLVYQARVEIGSDGNRRLVDAIGDVEAVDDFTRTVHRLEPVDAAEPALALIWNRQKGPERLAQDQMVHMGNRSSDQNNLLPAWLTPLSSVGRVGY